MVDSPASFRGVPTWCQKMDLQFDYHLDDRGFERILERVLVIRRGVRKLRFRGEKKPKLLSQIEDSIHRIAVDESDDCFLTMTALRAFIEDCDLDPEAWWSVFPEGIPGLNVRSHVVPTVLSNVFCTYDVFIEVRHLADGIPEQMDLAELSSYWNSMGSEARRSFLAFVCFYAEQSREDFFPGWEQSEIESFIRYGLGSAFVVAEAYKGKRASVRLPRYALTLCAEVDLLKSMPRRLGGLLS